MFIIWENDYIQVEYTGGYMGFSDDLADIDEGFEDLYMRRQK